KDAAAGKSDTVQGRQRRKDGSTFPVEIRLGSFEVEGETLHLGLVRDVSERFRAEEALRRSEAQFRSLADAIPQLCWTARADGWIDWYNQRWYEYTGTSAEQMQGWGWQSVHDPDALPAVLERWQACLSTGEPLDMVFPLRGADGVFRPFLTRVMALKDE